MKKLKLADIAALAGVSKSTVSFVLNGHAEKHRIPQSTVDKVMAVVNEHNYAPSSVARALKSKRTATFGLVIPDLTNIGFATIARKLEKLCVQQGYQLLIASTEDDPGIEENAVKNLLDRQVDGLMVASCHTSAEFYRSLNASVPVVFFDREFDYPEASFVVSDAEQSVCRLLTGLMSGANECVFIGGQNELSPSRERLAGYSRALSELGLSVEPEWVLQRDYQPESGYKMMEQCVNRIGRAPECLFTASYSLLEGVLRYLAQNPQLDVSKTRIATFDNYSILDCLPYKIDSIEQDCEQIAQLVFDCLSGKLSNSDTQQRHRVPARLHIRRESAADPG